MHSSLFAALPVALALALCGRAPAVAQADYAACMARAEAAKAAGDMAGMEVALAAALKAGPGDEYAWRSLAWAQMHQGKWRDSLASARANVRRNGKTSWSLSQLYESAMAAGDAALAKQALDDEARLPAQARDRDVAAERKAYAAATVATRYDLTWTLRVADYKLQKGEIVVNTPYRKHLWQEARVWVEGAEATRFEEIGGRDVLFIRPGSAAELTLRAEVTHKPALRGAAFAEAGREPACPPAMRGLLGPFRNRIDYDPADPALAPVVAALNHGKPGERVQAVLDWLAANVKYEDGYPDDLAAILRNRKGVCHHQSNLMVALCRALGVPAYVAHGVRLGEGDGSFTGVVASHGWVEVYLNGGWVGVEPLNPNSLRRFGSGYLIVDATGRAPGPANDHFLMYTPDGRHIEDIQGVPVSGTSRLAEPPARAGAGG